MKIERRRYKKLPMNGPKSLTVIIPAAISNFYTK